MRPRPLVHIGMPKCASTWLQRHFFYKDHGVVRLCPTSKDAFFALVAPTPFALSDWSEGAGMLNPIKVPRVPVVSLEVLVGNPLTGGDDGETILHRIRQMLPDTRILLIIREQRAMLRSIYKTLVTFGSPLSIATHLDNDLPGTIPAFGPHYLCYDRVISAYQHVFGADSVLVLPMEFFEQQPLEFLHQISDFCEIDLQEYPLEVNPEKRENTNLALANLEIKRFFNRYILKTRMSNTGLYKPALVGRSGMLDLPFPDFVDRFLERRFDRTVAAATEELFAQSNRRTRELTGLDLANYGYQLACAEPSQ